MSLDQDLPGLPATQISDWLLRNLPGTEPTDRWTAEIISGGLSNLTYRLSLPGRSLILRRPPIGPTLPRAHDVMREYRVLSALAGTGVPVPEALGRCADADVIGAPFYLMAEVSGRVLRVAADTAGLNESQRAALGDSLAVSLAALHGVDPRAVGLADFGRWGEYCRRQIRTWGAQWARSCTRSMPEMASLLDELEKRVPEDSATAIVHGDYRLDNTVVDLAGSPRVAAVLDWELSTLGDPLADVGTAMTYWHDLGDDERALIPVAAGVTAWPGFPRAQQFAERYAISRGIDLPDLSFYRALGAMKLAVILEGVHARYLGGKTVGEGYDSAGSAVPVLIARAREQLLS